MTVEKKEILELQKYVSSKIEKEKSSENPDSAKLFDLNILDSNISLLILGFDDSDKNSEIELGTRDKQIKSAILEFRKTKNLKNKVQLLAFDGSQAALDIIEQINNAKSNLENFCEDGETKILAENFLVRFDEALKILLPAASFSKSSKKNQKLWQTEKIDFSNEETNSFAKSRIPVKNKAEKNDNSKENKENLTAEEKSDNKTPSSRKSSSIKRQSIQK